jgi:hypothetical protein
VILWSPKQLGRCALPERRKAIVAGVSAVTGSRLKQSRRSRDRSAPGATALCLRALRLLYGRCGSLRAAHRSARDRSDGALSSASIRLVKSSPSGQSRSKRVPAKTAGASLRLGSVIDGAGTVRKQRAQRAPAETAPGAAGGLGRPGAMLVLRGRQPKGVTCPFTRPGRPAPPRRLATDRRSAGRAPTWRRRRASSCAARPTVRAMG